MGVKLTIALELLCVLGASVEPGGSAVCGLEVVEKGARAATESYTIYTAAHR